MSESKSIFQPDDIVKVIVDNREIGRGSYMDALSEMYKMIKHWRLYVKGTWTSPDNTSEFWDVGMRVVEITSA